MIDPDPIAERTTEAEPDVAEVSIADKLGEGAANIIDEI